MKLLTVTAREQLEHNAIEPMVQLPCQVSIRIAILLFWEVCGYPYLIVCALKAHLSLATGEGLNMHRQCHNSSEGDVTFISMVYLDTLIIVEYFTNWNILSLIDILGCVAQELL